jgi:rRNA maturation endonuclease Nob1
MTRVYVLDTAPLLSDWTKRVPDSLLLTVQHVVDEVVNKASIRRVQSLISSDRLRVESVGTHELLEVRDKATAVGDIGELSVTDTELIALALSKVKSGTEVVLVSADFAVLNTASSLGLTVIDSRGEFRHRVAWVYKCPACGVTVIEPPRSQECPTCGTRMRRKAQVKAVVGRFGA